MERGTEGCGGKRKHCATTTEEAVNAPKLQGPGSREASYRMYHALLSMAKRVQESEDAFDKKPLNNSIQAVLDDTETGEKLRTAAARAPCSEEAEKLIDRWVDFRWRTTGWLKGSIRLTLYYDNCEGAQVWTPATAGRLRVLPSYARGSRN